MRALRSGTNVTVGNASLIRGPRHWLRLTVPLLALASLISALMAVPASAASYSYQGQVYAVGLDNVLLLGQAVPGPIAGLFPLSYAQLPTDGTGTPDGKPIKGSGLGTVDASPLATADVLLSTVEGDTGLSQGSEHVANVALVPGKAPGNADVADVQVALADTHVNPSNTAATSPDAVATANVVGLKIAGTAIQIPSTYNTYLCVTSAGPSQTCNTNFLTSKDVVDITLRYRSVSLGGTIKSASASAVVLMFPKNGPLAAIIQGTVTIAHSDSSIGPAAATPTPTPTPRTTPTPGGQVLGIGDNGVRPTGFGGGIPVNGLVWLLVAAGLGLAGYSVQVYNRRRRAAERAGPPES